MKDRKILLLETATSVCSAALSVNGEVVAMEERDERNIHAAWITLFIDKVMSMAGLSYVDLDAIAISKGPGSYTGLRIGVSVAKGLCFSLDKPLIAISTLESLAKGLIDHQVVNEDAVLVPMIDARRMEVYTSIYTKELEVIENVNAKIVLEDSFDHLYAREILLFGDGAAKFREMFRTDNRILFPEIHSSAKPMAAIADSKYQAGDFEDLAYFEPLYLKDFVAAVSSKTS